MTLALAANRSVAYVPNFLGIILAGFSDGYHVLAFMQPAMGVVSLNPSCALTAFQHWPR